MTLLALLAASFTFSATATGVEKGSVVEFAFVDKGSDRDYESMFVLDGTIDEFCKGLEAAGIPRGKPEDVRACTLWPVGCTVEIKPSLAEYIVSNLGDGTRLESIVYTGGTRLPSGLCEATTNMPLSCFSLYSLSQSPLVFATHYSQSAVYNCHQAKLTLKKGTRVDFTLTWDKKTLPTPFSATFTPGHSADTLKTIKAASEKGEIDLLVDFSPDLSVKEASAIAQALALIDSKRVKINGRKEGHLFFRAFLPSVKWLDRKERLVQPFELTVGTTNSLVYIDADWSGEGLDPKLTPINISFAEASTKKDVDTCFLFVSPSTRLSQVYHAMNELKSSSVLNWYVYEKE